jgi:Histidine kinase-, DNA gyrase B-, and HSP90-like ATPase
LGPLMEETAALLRAALPDDARLIVERVPDAAVVRGDSAQLQQIVVNLCNNAYQALEGTGTITVTVDLHVLSRPRPLSHGKLSPGPYVCISVKDNGRGMSAATLGRLFEPFFTTRPEGNGIGLATVFEIVTSYAGVLHVTSRLKHGSAFDVWLPQVMSSSLDADGGCAGQIRGGGETVLVMNEDPARLLRDEEVIAALGYEPIGYINPNQALSACRMAPQRFDIVLISHGTSIPRALALATQLHALLPSTSIMLAASTATLDADLLADAGICEVVKAPLESAGLAWAIPRWLSAERFG